MLDAMRVGYWAFLDLPRLPEASACKLPRADKAWSCFNELLGLYRPRIVLIALSNILQRLMPLSLPLMIRFWLDALLQGSPVEIMGQQVAASSLLAGAIGLAFCAVAFQSWLVWWIGRESASVGHRLIADVRVLLYEHLLRLPVKYVETRGTGRVLLRFVGDSDAMRLWFARLGPMAAADQFLVVVLIAIMLVIDLQLALVVAIPALILAGTCKLFQGALRQATRTSRNLQANFTGAVEERLAQLRQFKWLVAGKVKDRSVQKLSQNVSILNSRRDALGASLEAVASLIASTVILLVLWIGITRVWSGSLSAGQIVAFVWIGFQLNETLRRLAAASVASQKCWVSTARILHLLSRSAEHGRGDNYERHRWRCKSVKIQTATDDLTESTLSYSYPGIYELPSSLEPVQLVESLLGFKQGNGINVSIDDKPLVAVNISQTRRSIGWVTLRPALFPGTLKDNLLLGCPVDAALDRKLANWSQVYFGATIDLHRWLHTPAARVGSKLKDHDLAFLSLLRSVLREARVYVVEPDAYACLPEELWNYLASQAIVLVGRANRHTALATNGNATYFSD